MKKSELKSDLEKLLKVIEGLDDNTEISIGLFLPGNFDDVLNVKSLEITSVNISL